MFKKFVARIAKAKTCAELRDILYGADGVDMMFQKEKIKWDEHEILFDLAAKVEAGF